MFPFVEDLFVFAFIERLYALEALPCVDLIHAFFDLKSFYVRLFFR